MIALALKGYGNKVLTDECRYDTKRNAQKYYLEGVIDDKNQLVF